ncbi:unnamed protein product [Allacma fusca]|uniref:Uncharacterized protein n=1 Tax=Allacma fusca TaxID=39272 RepID=A0A8J2LNP7_9HEXA|nr:unnamed protein product [Allacma fusca]
MRAYHALIFGFILTFGVASAKPTEQSSPSVLEAFENLQKNREKFMGALDSLSISEGTSPSEEPSKSPTITGKDDSHSDSKFPFSDFFSHQQKEISEGVSTVIKGAMGVSENIEKIFRDSIPTSSQVKNTARGFLDSIFADNSKS